MKQGPYHLVILGSGSTAFAAALRAQELGKTSVMTEGRTTGGTCVNRGCLPSKNLIEAAKIIHDARHPRNPGLTPAEVKLNFRELILQKDDVIHGYRKKKYESLVRGQFSIEEGHAEFLDGHTITVGGKRLTEEKILIASGSRPVVPAIEGLDQVPYLTSDPIRGNPTMASHDGDPPDERWPRRPFAHENRHCVSGRVSKARPIVAIIAPSWWHDLYLREYLSAYPDAWLYGAPTLVRWNQSLSFAEVLGDLAPSLWTDELRSSSCSRLLRPLPIRR
jgi:hypothetical protein